MARLRSDGVVQSRQGVGVFVVNNEENATLRIDADLMSDRMVFRNVFELRAILEIRAAGLAAMRSDAQQLDAIADAMTRMRNAVNWVKKASRPISTSIGPWRLPAATHTWR